MGKDPCPAGTSGCLWIPELGDPPTIVCCDNLLEVCRRIEDQGDRGGCKRIGECFTEYIYNVDSAEAELLRKYRDGILSKTSTGREIIRLYYEWSPVIVSAIEEDQEFKEELKELIDEMLPMIEEVVE